MRLLCKVKSNFKWIFLFTLLPIKSHAKYSLILSLSVWDLCCCIEFVRVGVEKKEIFVKLSLCHNRYFVNILKYEKLLTKKGQLNGCKLSNFRVIQRYLSVWFLLAVLHCRTQRKKISLKDFRSVMNVVADGLKRYT